MKRVRYFAGMLLSAEELKTDQSYYHEKRKMHNRCLHGYGVVCGLEVSMSKGGIRVSPGVALSCTGDEIVVGNRVEVPLPETKSSTYLTIKFSERETDPVPVPGSDKFEHSRIEETFELSFQPHDPCHGHKGTKSHALACGKAHAMPIGKLVHGREGWRIDREFNPPRVVGHQQGRKAL
jgi:hypothetical protein